jgi:hypothetical protein
MRPVTSDPTAGERARAIRTQPAAAQPILDPMDRRYGELRLDDPAAGAQAGVILDPTDPENGARPS